MSSEDSGVWYALRTFFAQENKVSTYLEQNALEFFVPMIYSMGSDAEGNPVRCYRPAVHNLIFIRKTTGEDVLKAILQKCPYTIQVYRKQSEEKEWYPIRDSEILELRMICDRSFEVPPIITEHNGDLPIGRMVKVVHGPMKGIKGKLVRKNKKYYLLKTLANLDVKIAVSRWCCESLDTNIPE